VKKRGGKFFQKASEKLMSPEKDKEEKFKTREECRGKRGRRCGGKEPEPKGIRKGCLLFPREVHQRGLKMQEQFLKRGWGKFGGNSLLLQLGRTY